MTLKLWTPNEVLTSTDMNNLSKQAVTVCTSGTRPSSPPEGMTIYETDNDVYAKWTGSGWDYFASSRKSFTPTLTAATTSPTMGSGATRQGWWVYLPGPSVLFTFNMKFGSSLTVGSGSYFVSIPVTAANPFSGTHSAVGSIQVADASANAFRVGSCFVDSSNLGQIGLVADGGQVVSSGQPFAWAAGDYISGSITYPI